MGWVVVGEQAPGCWVTLKQEWRLQAGGGWRRLEEVGGDQRMLEEARGGQRKEAGRGQRLEEVGGGWRLSAQGED